MTYYTDHHSSSFGTADNPLHAGTTRKFLQDNCLSVYKNSGFDLCAHNMQSSSMSASIGTTWTWLDDWITTPIPLYRSIDGGWRGVSFEVLAKTSSSTMTLRIFLLPTFGERILDSNGEVANAEYNDISITSTSFYWYNTSITYRDEGSLLGGSDTVAITQPVCYVGLAAQHSSGTRTIYIETMRFEEGY